MDFNNTCLSCAPYQIVTLTDAITDISNITIYDQKDNPYCDCDFKYSYSVDGACWSCYACKDTTFNLTTGLNQDFFIRIKMRGSVGGVKICNEDVNYSCALDSGFDFSLNCQTVKQVYSPYANMDNAIALQQYLSNMVSCIVGVPIYYFKVNGVEGSKDLTFKEYALKEVTSVKQLKLIIADGSMPSSKPEFNDFGIDFATDWETEINKSDFATAFGVTAQPMEGDFIWIPLMKRMWQVNGAYEEKKDSLMWQNTTFKVALVKYQEKASIDLNEQEDFVNSLVSATYEDLFGENENIDSGEEHSNAPFHAPNNLYNVFESDAVRKQATVETLQLQAKQLNQKAVMVADNVYVLSTIQSQIVYQRKFCGDQGSISFIFSPKYLGKFKNIFIQVANLHLQCEFGNDVTLTLLNHKETSIKLNNGDTYFVYLRWSKKMNIIEMTACKYSLPNGMPMYKAQNFHYFFDVDNPYAQKISKYDIEMIQDNKGDIVVNNVPCEFTNFKVFDIYNDNIGEMLQQYPNSAHLLVNDTARQFLDVNGVKLS